MRSSGVKGRGRGRAGRAEGTTGSQGRGAGDPPPGSRATGASRRRRWGKADAYEERRAQWAALARSLGGGFLRAEKPLYDAIHLPHRSWEITVDTYVQSDGNSAVFYTRVRAPFRAQDDFSFRVSRANVFTRLLDRVGVRDVRTGDPRIDARYVIRGSNVGRVRSFFLDGRVRAVLLEQESCRLDVGKVPWRERRRRQGRIRQVRIRAKGEFLDPVRIRGLIRLCTTTLDRLVSSGTASLTPVEPVRRS